MDIFMYPIIFGLGIVMEFIDSSLGMMYGTILSPVLILMGFDAKIVVPAILFSQAVGGLTATIRHNKFKNADFNGYTRDIKVVLSVVIPGLVAVLLGVFLALSIPKQILNIYIAVLVIIMGGLCIRPVYYTFNWWKMWIVGFLSAFNKSISGGGYGPVTSTGKILGGLPSKVSIATTTFAEVPICLTSFALYFFMKGISGWDLLGVLTVASIIGGFLGPYVTFKFDTKWLKIVVGILAILAGLGVLILKLNP